MLNIHRQLCLSAYLKSGKTVHLFVGVRQSGALIKGVQRAEDSAQRHERCLPSVRSRVGSPVQKKNSHKSVQEF